MGIFRRRLGKKNRASMRKAGGGSGRSGERRVATEAGARRYGVPIGTPLSQAKAKQAAAKKAATPTGTKASKRNQPLSADDARYLNLGKDMLDSGAMSHDEVVESIYDRTGLSRQEIIKHLGQAKAQQGDDSSGAHSGAGLSEGDKKAADRIAGRVKNQTARETFTMPGDERSNVEFDAREALFEAEDRYGVDSPQAKRAKAQMRKAYAAMERKYGRQ